MKVLTVIEADSSTLFAITDQAKMHANATFCRYLFNSMRFLRYSRNDITHVKLTIVGDM